MAILRGFPPSNTISPGRIFLPEDLPQPAEKPEVGAKNHWVRTYKLKKAKAGQFTMKSRMIVPDDKLMAEMIAASKAAGGDTWKTPRVKGVMEPDKSKQPRFMSSEA